MGEAWKSSDGRLLAILGSEEAGVDMTIKPDADGARVFEIPIQSGILNQEGQAVDWEGGFWALNREKVEGEEKWITYYRNVAGAELHSPGMTCADSRRTLDEEGCPQLLAADRNRFQRERMC
jgi:BNR repeat-containing family member